jgi:hypothetical protein
MSRPAGGLLFLILLSLALLGLGLASSGETPPEGPVGEAPFIEAEGKVPPREPVVGSESAEVPPKYSIRDGEVPQIYYGTVEGVALGYQTPAHIVALTAREAFYDYFRTGNETSLERGVFLTEYLVSHAVPRGYDRFVVWENGFPWPPYDLPPGWIGSLSQAGVLKALMLAYEATGDERYLEVGERALKAFTVYREGGGLLDRREDGYVWYPEYVGRDPPYVLNGFITTVLWIGKYAEVRKDPEAALLYEEGLRSLSHFLPRYDLGNWSLYDARGTVATAAYHRIHVEQMLTLYRRTGDPTFLEYHERWKAGLRAQESGRSPPPRGSP